MRCLKEKLKDNIFLYVMYNNAREIYYKNLISDEKILKRIFKKRVGRELDLNNPEMYNDKLQWLKLNWSSSLASKCADKYNVRDYIKTKIGEDYLIDIIKVYNSVDEINLDELPEKFVMKCTHGSGCNIICEDKSKLDWKKESRKLRRWLKTNYYLAKREVVYQNIKPRIICEKFLVQNDGEELRDYRFFCFKGEPKFITVDFSITDKKKTRRNLYDLEWNLMDEEISYPKETEIEVDKPEKLEEMIEISKKLSSGFPHARVDFYYIENKIIFGEITFFHQSGMGKIKPEKFELEMGSWLELPIANGGNQK